MDILGVPGAGIPLGGDDEEVAQAIKASGAIVSVEPNDFEAILNRVEAPLVVCATSRFISTKYLYLTSYKGLIFFTKSGLPLSLKPTVEVIEAKKIWVPE
jgi:hypothetical protein